MRDPTGEIRTTFYSLLNGSLAYGGVNFQVFKNMPKMSPNEYVYISAINIVNDSGKDAFVTDCSIEFTAIIKDISQHSRFIDVDDVMNDISILVIKKYISFTNYYMITTPVVVNTSSQEYEENEKLISERKMSINFKLQEK